MSFHLKPFAFHHRHHRRATASELLYGHLSWHVVVFVGYSPFCADAYCA